jgi:hypothetical protein
MYTIPDYVVRKLIAAGLRKDLDLDNVPEDLIEIREHDEINRVHGREWERVLAGLQLEEIVAVARALAIAEETFHWAGGSVAGVVWAYRCLSTMHFDGLDELGRWIGSRDRNPYAPRLPEVYEARQASLQGRLRRAAENIEADLARKTARQAKKARHRERSRLHAQERGELLFDFQQLSRAAQLEIIARDRVHSLDYYPRDCACPSDEDLKDLPPSLRFQLSKKAHERRKGIWKDLAKRLDLLDSK